MNIKERDLDVDEIASNVSPSNNKKGNEIEELEYLKNIRIGNKII